MPKLQTENKTVCSSLDDRYLEDYAAFMTTPGTHNDTYAATAHRMFFANWVRNWIIDLSIIK